MRDALVRNNIVIVQAAMPFRGFDAVAISSTARVIRQSLAIFGGGMNLCVQAVLMACDAGSLNTGQRCIAFSADKAIVARAAHTHSFLAKGSRFTVEHILCKPLRYQITRGDESPQIHKHVTPARVQLKPSGRQRETQSQEAEKSIKIGILRILVRVSRFGLASPRRENSGTRIGT